MIITLPGILSGLTTEISYYGGEERTIENPNQLLRFHRGSDFDTAFESALS